MRYKFKRIRDISLRHKLMFSHLFIVTFTLIVFSAIAFINSSAISRAQMSQSVKQTVSLAKSKMLDYMYDVQNDLFLMQADRELQLMLMSDDKENFWNNVNRLNQKILNIDVFRKKTSQIHLYVIDKPGYPDRYSANNVISSSVAVNEPWYLNTIKFNGKPCWSVFYNSNSDSSIAVSRLIKDTVATGRLLAVARVDIDTLTFLSRLDSIKIGKTGKVFLTKDNLILSNSHESFINDLVNESSFYSAINDTSNKEIYRRINGTEYLIVHDNLDETGLKIVGMVKSSEINESSKAIGYSMLITGILSLLIAIILSVFISYAVTDNIYKLANIMKNFEDDIDLRVKVTSNDEIGFLYRSFNKMMIRIRRLVKDIDDMSKKQKNAELKALQAQINPHFLHNTLDSINWLAQKYNADDISMMASALGNFFRHSLNNGKEYITIENELEQVKSYTEIQRMRYKERFEMKVDVDENILCKTIIKLTLQPLVENSIIHGFEGIDYRGVIKINGYGRDGFIFLEVIDNGVGTDTDILNELINIEGDEEKGRGSYGIRNVNQRIKLYFGQECGIRFEKNPEGGVKAIVKIKEV